MYRVRTTKTKSNATAVQVVKTGGHRVEMVKHIGSGHTSEEVAALKELATNWIDNHSPQKGLFEDKTATTLVACDNLKLVSTHPKLIHQLCMETLEFLGFDQVFDQLILDLVFMRLVEPASKRASIQLLSKEYGINHSLRTLNRRLRSLPSKKTKIEKLAVSYAKEQLGFDFRLVFYDVTTLYFESFKADELRQGVRQTGFSKDNKHQQPQLVLGLLVTNEGFPLGFRVFAGNKFEGKTLIPILDQFKRQHQINQLTVVADAAMISQANVDLLDQEGVGYIVGARLKNLSDKLIEEIDQKLEREDGQFIRIATKRGQLICHYSQKRHFKDKHETKKQILKAKQALKYPGKAVKRLKFIKADSKDKISFNESLLNKTKKLWGIKGYYTNQKNLTNQQIINHYHNLWQVEKSFRISKSDLQARPIYHRKTQPIVAHLLICFAALCVAKHWEIQTGNSIKKLVRLLNNIADATLQDELSKQTFTLRQQLSTHEEEVVAKLSSH